MHSPAKRLSARKATTNSRKGSAAQHSVYARHTVADVILLGGGSLGLWTALFLKRAGLRVRVLESNTGIGLRSTSMNASLGSRMFVCNPQVWALTHVGMGIWEKPMPGVFSGPIATPIDVLYLARAATFEARMRELSSKARASRALYRFIEPAELACILPHTPRSERAGGVVERGLRFDVPAALSGLACSLVHDDPNAIVTSAFTYRATRSASDTWQLDTLRGAFEAPIVIDATGSRGGETGRLFGGHPIRLKVTKRHRFLASVRNPERLTRPGLFVFSDGDFYWTVERDGTVLFSPGDETSCTAQDNDYDAEIVSEAIAKFQQMTGLAVDEFGAVTAGHRPYVDGRIPVACADPATEGLMRLLAPSGYGMQGGPALAMIMAALVTDTAMPKDLSDLGMTFETFALTPSPTPLPALLGRN